MLFAYLFKSIFKKELFHSKNNEYIENSALL